MSSTLCSLVVPPSSPLSTVECHSLIDHVVLPLPFLVNPSVVFHPLGPSSSTALSLFPPSTPCLVTVSFFFPSPSLPSMSLCRSCCGMSPKISQQIERKLKEIVAIYPHTTCIVVLSREGAVISGVDVLDLTVPGELHAPIASLKKTAVEMGHSLSTDNCPVVHIRGNTHTFTCYDVGKSLLAMYSEDVGGKGEMDPFDDVELEKRMEGALAELRLLLQNLQV